MGGPSKVFKKLVKKAEEKNIVKKVEQPKVNMSRPEDMSNDRSGLAPIDMSNARSGKAPIDMSNAELSLANKRKGRKKTILTSVTGVDNYPTLSKKTLLG